MTTRKEMLQRKLVSYRDQFRTATPFERSVMLIAMRTIMEEIEKLTPSYRQHTPLYRLRSAREAA